MYSLAMIFVAKLYWGYVLATNFIHQNLPSVYLCVVDYVCLLHRAIELMHGSSVFPDVMPTDS